MPPEKVLFIPPVVYRYSDQHPEFLHLEIVRNLGSSQVQWLKRTGFSVSH